jgi:predicted dehydrogenase
MKPVKLGLIGCGVVGSINLADAQQCEAVDVVAVADLRAERREYAKSQGVTRVYEGGRDLIDGDDEVEAVIIAFPAAARTAMALRAFARGKHVLIEKPVAMSAREVETMIEARGDLTAACFSSRHRMCDSGDAATKLVASGVLGEIRTLHFRVHAEAGPPPSASPPPWRESFSMNAGGILTNWSCYDLDYILGIAGWSFEPRTVLGQYWPCVPLYADRVAPESDADAYYTALVTGRDGSVLTIERGEFMPAHAQAAWQIVGTDGSLTLAMTGGEGRRFIHDRANPEGGVTQTVVFEGTDPPPAGNPRVIRDFAEAIRSKRAPATGFEQALLIARISEAVYASAHTRRAVEFD